MPPSDRGETLFAGTFTGRRHSLASLRFVLPTLLALAAVPALFFGGEYVQRYLRYRAERLAEAGAGSATAVQPLRHIALHTLYELPKPWLDQRLLDSGLPVYDLEISRGNLQRLQRTAETVLARGRADGVQRDRVPARFLDGGQWVPVQVRLRGATAYHYLKTRPSMRIRFPNDRYFRRMREINLSEPYDKRLTGDMAVNGEARRLGMMTWDSRFVIVRLNGEVLGLYQEIEQFGESIPARHRRSEGFIFSGSGEVFGKPAPGNPDFELGRRAMDRVLECIPRPGGQPALHCTDWEFVRDHFDTDWWAWATAMTTLLHSRHAWAPDNLRLFWDPSRGKFEPIPWDYLSFRLDPLARPEGEPDYSGTPAESLLRVPEFRRMRDERLWRLLNERVDPLIARTDELFAAVTDALKYDVRHVSFAPDVQDHREYQDTLRTNRKVLLDLFGRHDLRGEWAVSADGSMVVDVRNHGKSFVAVQAVVLETAGGRIRRELPEPVVVDGLWERAPGRVALAVAVPRGSRLLGLVARDHVTGAQLTDDEVTLRPHAGPLPAPPPPPAAPAPPEIHVPGVVVEPTRVVFGPGPVRLEGVFEIPSTHDVVFEPGLRLTMGDGAALVVRGNFSSVGTESAPIHIAGERADSPWGGIFVQGTRTSPSTVRVEHTTVEGGTGGTTERTRFVSPFSVHDGVVTIRFSRFLRNGPVDDGVNLKNARVHLEGNSFVGSRSDALDCDFCTGTIAGNHVVASGGDGLDFSGSDVVVSGNVIEGCADKSLSIGEQTNATVTDHVATNCHTGIAVKDSSVAEIRNADLRRLQVGVSLYVKKPTFGPSTAVLENVRMAEVATKYLRDSACNLTVR